jgi:hypothetical protein
MVLFLLLFGLFACSDGEDSGVSGGAATAGMAGMEKLVPEDAAIIVRFSSINKIEGELKRMAVTLDAPLPMNPFSMMAMASGVDMAQVDRSRPMAIAFSFIDENPGPVPTFIMPLKNVQAAIAAIPKSSSATSGDYAGISMIPNYKAGGSSLARGLLRGDLSVRIDLKKIIGMFRESIAANMKMAQAMMEQGQAGAVPGYDPAEMFNMMFGEMQSILDSAETFDMAINSNQGNVDLQVALTALEGRPLAQFAKSESTLIDLARHLPDDFPVAALLKVDLSAWNEMVGSMTEAMVASIPEEEREAFKLQMQRSMECMQGLGDEFLMGARIGVDGPRFVMAARAQNAEEYAAKYAELMCCPDLAEAGWAVSDEGVRDESGWSVRRLSMQLDAEKYARYAQHQNPAVSAYLPEMRSVLDSVFCESGLIIDMAALDGKVLWIVGPDGSLTSDVLNGKKIPDAVKKAIGSTGGRLSFLVNVEMRELMRGIFEFARVMDLDRSWPEIRGGDALSVMLYGATEGRIYRGGMKLPLDGLVEFFKTFN